METANFQDPVYILVLANLQSAHISMLDIFRFILKVLCMHGNKTVMDSYNISLLILLLSNHVKNIKIQSYTVGSLLTIYFVLY